LVWVWIKKYPDVDNKGKWRLFLDLQLGKLGGEISLRGEMFLRDLNQSNLILQSSGKQSSVAQYLVSKSTEKQLTGKKSRFLLV